MAKHVKENDRLRKIVEAFPKTTVTVLGDLVADEFVFGEISRVKNVKLMVWSAFSIPSHRNAMTPTSIRSERTNHTGGLLAARIR